MTGSRTLVRTMLMGIALGVAAVGGYVAAGWLNRPSPDNDGGGAGEPARDPTRLHRPADQPGASPRLRQDSPEFNAAYAAENPTLNYGAYQSLPDWVKREITDQQPVRLSQDSPEFISQYANP